MRTFRNIWNDLIYLLPQIFRFGFVGLVATSIYFLINVISVSGFGGNPKLVNSIAITISACVSYFGHHYFTFCHRGSHYQNVPRFIFQLILAYSISQSILHLVLAASLSYLIAIIITIIVLPAINFICLKLFVFRQKAG